MRIILTLSTITPSFVGEFTRIHRNCFEQDLRGVPSFTKPWFLNTSLPLSVNSVSFLLNSTSCGAVSIYCRTGLQNCCKAIQQDCFLSISSTIRLSPYRFLPLIPFLRFSPLAMERVGSASHRAVVPAVLTSDPVNKHCKIWRIKCPPLDRVKKEA